MAKKRPKDRSAAYARQRAQREAAEASRPETAEERHYRLQREALSGPVSRRASHVAALVNAAERRRALEEETRDLVQKAVRSGSGRVSWAEVGTAFGISGETARYRWGRSR